MKARSTSSHSYCTHSFMQQADSSNIASTVIGVFIFLLISVPQNRDLQVEEWGRGDVKSKNLQQRTYIIGGGG